MTQTTLILEPRLDLHAVPELAAALAAHDGQDLILDAARVEHFGALAVQLLQSAAQARAGNGHGLDLVNCSDDVTDQLSLLGFTADGVTLWEPRA